MPGDTEEFGGDAPVASEIYPVKCGVSSATSPACPAVSGTLGTRGTPRSALTPVAREARRRLVQRPSSSVKALLLAPARRSGHPLTPRASGERLALSP